MKASKAKARFPRVTEGSGDVLADIGVPAGYVPNDPKYGGIDPGIVQIVRILAENGVETCQSCAASGPFGEGSGKKDGDAHAYPEPTVEFHGRAAAGWHALEIAINHGLPVHQLRRVWSMQDGVPVGPIWAMTFILNPQTLVGWMAPGCEPYTRRLTVADFPQHDAQSQSGSATVCPANS